MIFFAAFEAEPVVALAFNDIIVQIFTFLDDIRAFFLWAPSNIFIMIRKLFTMPS